MASLGEFRCRAKRRAVKPGVSGWDWFIKNKGLTLGRPVSNEVRLEGVEPAASADRFADDALEGITYFGTTLWSHVRYRLRSWSHQEHQQSVRHS